MSEPEDVKLIDGVIVRPHDDGSFDELVGEKIEMVHAEMMDKDCLWIGIYPNLASNNSVMMWIRAVKGKLVVTAEKD